MYGTLYSIGTASLDDTDARIVHVPGALFIGNTTAGDHFGLAAGLRRVRIDEVIDNTTLRLLDDWPDEPFEDAVYFVLRDAESRNPPLAQTRVLRDQYERLRIFDYARPIFAIKEFGVAEPPDYAVDEACVVGADAEGVFFGRESAIARKTEAGWELFEPKYGWQVVSEIDPNGNNTTRVWTGSEWALPNLPVVFNVAMTISGRPQAGEEPPGFVFTEFVTFPAGLAGSRAKAQVAATSEAVIGLEKNGTQFGTLIFAAEDTTGVLDSDSEVSFEDGDVLTWIWPSPRDATLAGVSMTLRGIA